MAVPGRRKGEGGSEGLSVVVVVALVGHEQRTSTVGSERWPVVVGRPVGSTTVVVVAIVIVVVLVAVVLLLWFWWCWCCCCCVGK